MQQVYLTLVSGGEAQSASYSQAAGARSVTYTQANLAHLVQAIIGMGKQTQIDSLTVSVATGRRRFSRSSDGHLSVRPLAASSAPDSWECVLLVRKFAAWRLESRALPDMQRPVVIRSVGMRLEFRVFCHKFAHVFLR